MTNWPTKKLGEVAYFQEGPGLRTFQFKPRGIRVINVANVREGFLDLSKTKFLDTTEVEQKYKHFLVNKDDILVSTSGTIGRVAWVEKKNLPLMLNTSVVRFHTLDEKSLLNRFLFYFLSGGSFRNELLKYKTGVAIFNVGPSHLKKIKIPLPPLAIQKQIVERLDKIVEAQKLNDGLIQKTDELFQSLLHKELNPAGKNWKEDKFVNCIEKNPLKIKGIPREKYQSIGKFPIIDQSDKFTVGYTDNEDKVYEIDSPVIIFGDHTRIFKYIDFNFAIGADGTQIIIPDRKIIIPKFFYFLMLNFKIPNLGYSRHFKILKTKKLIIPPLNTQKQIVAKLSAAQDYKNQLLEQKQKIKELFDSVLHKSMANE